MAGKRFTTAEAAEAIGIHRVTLQEWISRGKIKPPKPVLRNGHGVRLWSKVDIEQVKKVKQRIYRRGRGRKKARLS